MHWMRRSRRSALPCRHIRLRRLMRSPAARRSPSLHRCVRRSELLAAGADAVSFDRFSALLRAPELQAGGAERGRRGAARRAAAQARSERGRRGGVVGALRNASRRCTVSLPSPLCSGCASAFRVLDELRGSQPISRWVAAWIAAFEAGPWSLRHRWSSVEYQAAERFRELAGDARGCRLVLRHAFARGRRSVSCGARRWRRHIQAQTGVPPIWVSGQLIDPWLHYDGLWVSGCSAERWPPPVRPHSLAARRLAARLRRDCRGGGIAAAIRARSAESLERRAPASACSATQPRADGRAAAPSPVLPEAAVDQPPALPRPHWRALLQVRATARAVDG